MAIQALRRLMRVDTEATGPSDLPRKWPPSDDDAVRFRTYQKHRSIWRGNHALALDEQDIAGRYGQYIAVNIPKIIVTIPADFLFGEEFELTYDEGTLQEAQDVVKAIVERSKLHTLLYESALDCGVYGDSVLTVERDEEGRSRIKAQPVSTWFPDIDPDDVRAVKAHWFGWKRVAVIGGKEVEFLRLQKHEPGTVLNYLMRLEKDGVLIPASDTEWTALYPGGRPDASIPTGIEGDETVDGYAVEVVPNWRTAEEYHGTGEYNDTEGMFASVNARVTQNDQVLHRHSDPILSLHPDILNSERNRASTMIDGHGRPLPGRIDKSRLDVVAQGPNGEAPVYVTWDGKLSDNLAYIEQMVNLIALVSETAPQLLNQGEWGGELSGRALKILLVRTLAKVNRRRKYYSDAIPNLLVKAQMVEGVAKPVRPTVKWADGLPQDVMESVEVESQKLAAGIQTKVGAIMAVDDISEEAAEKKAQEIAEQEDADRNSEALNNAVMGGRPGQPGQERPNPIEVRLGG